MDDRLKCRFWNTELNQYEGPGCGLIFVDPKTSKVVEIDHGIMVEERTELNPEQCTGLKDEKGKLIYEGDIISGALSQSRREVVWDKDNWCGRINRWRIVTIVAWQDFKIVGNINENPELMK